MESVPAPQSPPAVRPLGYERPKELAYEQQRSLPYVRPGSAAGRGRRLYALATWISVGFGAWQLLAPRSFARTVGMTYPNWLIRATGARDLGLGIGMLAKPESGGWRWARAASDVMDTGLIGAAFLMRGSDRARLAAFAGVAAGVVALDMRVAAAKGIAPEGPARQAGEGPGRQP
jgi:hypothetical protein